MKVILYKEREEISIYIFSPIAHYLIKVSTEDIERSRIIELCSFILGANRESLDRFFEYWQPRDTKGEDYNRAMRMFLSSPRAKFTFFIDEDSLKEYETYYDAEAFSQYHIEPFFNGTEIIGYFTIGPLPIPELN